MTVTMTMTMTMILLDQCNPETTKLNYTEVHYQVMAFTQSPPLSDNPKILSNYQICTDNDSDKDKDNDNRNDKTEVALTTNQPPE